MLNREIIDAYRIIQAKNSDNEEKYFFEESENLIEFIIYLYASSLINQHLCIIGPPGIGKTLCARTFSLIREFILKRKYKSSFNMHTFNEYTRPSDYYGILTIKNDELEFVEGTLTRSLNEGNVFIGDEFNISSEDAMKAIFPSLVSGTFSELP